MKRSSKVCWIAFISSALVLGAVIGLVVFFVKSNNKNPDSDANPGSGGDLLGTGVGGAGTTAGGNGGFDHRSHAVLGGPYEAIDYNGEGKVVVELDGTQSHSHYYKEEDDGTVVVGKIEKFKWTDNSTGEVIGEDETVDREFKVGVSKIGLEVVDNTGDKHTDYTTVVVEASVRRGAFCYVYKGESIELGKLTEDPKPVDGLEIGGNIEFEDEESFEGVGGDAFVMRCVFRVNVEKDGDVGFKMEVSGEGKLVVDGEGVIDGKGEGKALQGSMSLKKGSYNAEAIYVKGKGGDPRLVVDAGDITFDRAKLLPVIKSLTPPSSTLVGGGNGKIAGYGFGKAASVYFGATKASPIDLRSDNTTLWFEVPKTTKEETVQVTVQNEAGTSNPLPFKYSSSGLAPIEFESTFLTSGGKKWEISTVTNIVYGPDHKYYISGLNGLIYKFAVNKDLEVGDICHGESVGENRAVLGLAFNPREKKPILYASSSVLDWKVKFKLSGKFAWANGMIHTLEADEEKCIVKIGDVITQLPVSNHDHGVNGLVFGQDGRLHFQVGGFTNAGYNKPGNKLGGIDENPFSGASLVADVTKSGFDGDIKYSSSDPSTARYTGKDVKIWSTGWRNSYGITIHSNGKLYASDNGPSDGFGTKSVSCTKDEPLVPEDIADKVGLNEEGHYYGHPNRNRGRDNERECIFFPPDSKSADFSPPLAQFTSSTDGLLEYTSNVFDGQMKQNLLVTKYAADKNPGAVYRMSLNEDGTLEFGPDVLWEESGLSVAMSPWGDIIMPRVFKKEIMVLRPKWEPRDPVALNAVVPFRGPSEGGNTVIISGIGFNKGTPSATFDDNPCTDVSNVASDGSSFMCKAPAGKPGAKVQVVVKVGSTSSGATIGTDYWYTL